MKIQQHDKVICVDDKFDSADAQFFTALPRKGRVYAVREALVNPICNTPTIRLVGITGAIIRRADFETGFLASRFRLLSEVNESVVVGTHGRA